jgi:protein arginine N-methyltransferase 1
MESVLSQPGLQMKVNPDTYVKFEGLDDWVTLQNIASEQAVRIKSDILLVMWEMVRWRSLQEILAPWPPEDQEKLRHHFEMMLNAKILITEEGQATVQNESGLAAHLGNKVHINVENHHAMLRDFVRLAAYRRAIETQVAAIKAQGQPCIALDLGCGSGILTFFALQAGADHVLAVEQRPDILLMAQGLAKDNGFADRITFIEGNSSQLPASRFSPKPNLFISEILGNGILEENVLEFTLDARKRILEPGAPMVPGKLAIEVFAYSGDYRIDRFQEVQELNALYGLDFSLLATILGSKTQLKTDRYHTSINKALSGPVVAKVIDFTEITDTFFTEPVSVPITQEGDITGFCAYFRAWLDQDTQLTNSPWAPQTHWTQLLFQLPKPITVKAGQTVQLEVIYDGALRFRMA